MTNSIGGLDEYAVRLEMPLNEREARQRGIASSLCLMQVTPANRSLAIQLVAAAIYEWCPEELSVIICPINNFEKTTHAMVAERDLTLFPDLNAAAAVSPEGVAAVLRGWDAEAHVMFFGDSTTLRAVQSAANAGLVRWWQFSRKGPEGRYLASLGVADPLLFFATSHGSVEVVGTRGAVLRCFDAIPRSS